MRDRHAMVHGMTRILVSALTMALVSCGASVHDLVARGDQDALEARLSERPDLIETRNELGKTPLHYAITFAEREAMTYLIEAGADVSASDNTGLTPLHLSAIVDLRGAARLLVRTGASLEAADDFGDTPLHSAAMHGSMRVLEYLLDQGADASTANYEGLTPLELARRYGRAEALRYLERFEGTSE